MLLIGGRVQKRAPRREAVALHLLTGHDPRTCEKFLAGEPIKGPRIRESLEKAHVLWAEVWPSIKTRLQEIAVS